MSESPFFRFTDAEVREMLAIPNGPISDEAAALAGLERIATQKGRVLLLARRRPDVDWIYGQLGGKVEKSSIRSYLCVASARGDLGEEWRQRRRRRSSGGAS